MTFDIKKYITESNNALGEVGCQGCGWNKEPDREKYCKTCDPSGDKESNRKKSDITEQRDVSIGHWAHDANAWLDRSEHQFKTILH